MSDTTTNNANLIPTEAKNVVLTKTLNGVIYALAIRTSTDMVFTTDYKYTLTELLQDIEGALTDHSKKIATVSEGFNALMKDCPEEFNTIKKIADYLNINGDPKSALIKMIESKQDAEEGKGLSTNDFTDLLKTKLENGYSKEDLDDKFEIIQKRISDIEEANNIYMTEKNEVSDDEVKNNDIWFKIIEKETE